MIKQSIGCLFLIFQLSFLESFSQKIILQNWKFTKAQLNDWRTAQIPGTIHQDLMNHSIIGNVFDLDAESYQNWVEHSDWEYKCTFSVTDKNITDKNIDLVLEGVDTYATIYLNNDSVASIENMFVGYTFPIKNYLKNGENTLKLYFHSATKINRNKAFLHPYNIPAVNEKAYKSERYSIYSRKAPFHFGWDWGPRIVTCGLWRPAYINIWDKSKIESQGFHLQNLSTKVADYKSDIEISSTKAENVDIQTLVNNQIVSTQKANLKIGKNIIEANFQIKSPKLWWTNGLGEQYLYTITSKIISNKATIDSKTTQIGVRTIEIIREKDEFEGKSFKIRLNGVDVFMKGSNYIPGDNLTPRVQTKEYKKLIAATKNANMNMLRVWGGAIYENDEFYSLCDEAGILVWQDFMFACAMSPGDDKHIKNLESEFEYNVKRMRNHPSLALWCGNNENMEKWFHYSWKKEFKISTSDSLKIMETYKKIFYDLIPKTISKYDPTRFYWPCSPGSDYEISESKPTSGDLHNWWIWFGNATFDQIANQKVRFTSEYGLQSYPDLGTLMTFARPQDTTFDCYAYDYRQRSELSKTFFPYPNLSYGNEIIANYINMYYRKPKNFENFIFLSQAMQGEGLRKITEAHRASKPYSWGSLYWQLDDCWPTISWATMDYFFNWKASHYAVKQANKPTIIYSKIDSTDKKIKIYVVSDVLKSQKIKYSFQLIDFSGKILNQSSKDVLIKENTSTLVFELDLLSFTQNIDITKAVLNSKIEVNGEVLDENNLYFKLPKDLNLERNRVNYKLGSDAKGNYILLETDKLSLGTTLKLQHDEGFFDNNFFDLIPNYPQKVYYSKDINNEYLLKNLRIFSINNSY